MRMGYNQSQVMAHVPDLIMKPPNQKIEFGLESLGYAWRRLESIGFRFGEKVRDIFHNGNSFFSGT